MACCFIRNATSSTVPSTCHASHPSAQRLCSCYLSAQCPIGWVPYLDNGVEGHDSCLLYNSTKVPFTTALASCPSGSHLVTIKGPSASTSRLYDTVLGVSNYFVTSASVWLGCSQAWAQPYKNYGWSWIDGTSNANLYNGMNNITGFGLWSPGEPE